ncbi:hypothetical protein [Bacillus thuringiensis]|uniref:hypothetical protein n=1 Tax=Bacillus thuringiensis TaxID=1428 RepID=UPI003F5B16F4
MKGNNNMNYKLVEKTSSMKNTFIITIKADSNDGDYITEEMHYSKSDFEEILPELVNLRDNYGDNHQLENYPNPMDFNIPYNGWDGYCHSLEKLSVEYIDENGKMFDVEF